MNSSTAAGGERFEVAYLVSSGTSTAARCPELLRGLVGLGFSTVIAIPTPNAARVISPREPAAAARGGAICAVQLQLAQQAGTRHRRQPRAVRRRRGDRAGDAGNRRPVA